MQCVTFREGLVNELSHRDSRPPAGTGMDTLKLCSLAGAGDGAGSLHGGASRRLGERHGMKFGEMQ